MEETRRAAFVGTRTSYVTQDADAPTLLSTAAFVPTAMANGTSDTHATSMSSKPNETEMSPGELESLLWGDDAEARKLYETRRLLGRGGMATVFEVYHREWRLPLALKVPHSTIFQSVEDQQAFSQECEEWVKLGLHPNIVCAYMVKQIQGIPRVFAELIAGGDLLGYIKQQTLYEHLPNCSNSGPNPLDQDSRSSCSCTSARFFDCAIQLAWGVAFAHKHGLVHQDLKPANVMVANKDGALTFKVTDFGLVSGRDRVSSTDCSAPFGSAFVAGGTPAYWAPEQAEGYRVMAEKGVETLIDQRADIYSYGVTMLHVITGTRPWRDGSVGPTKLLSAYRDHRLPCIPQQPQLLTVLEKCLQVDPALRFQSMEEVTEALIAAHKEAVGKPYLKRPPAISADAPFSINNRALSCLELGREEEAEKLWKQVESTTTHSGEQHLDSVYNYGVWRWMKGDPNVTAETIIKNLTRCELTADQVVLRAAVCMEERNWLNARGALDIFKQGSASTSVAAISSSLRPLYDRIVRDLDAILGAIWNEEKTKMDQSYIITYMSMSGDCSKLLYGYNYLALRDVGPNDSLSPEKRVAVDVNTSCATLSFDGTIYATFSGQDVSVHVVNGRGHIFAANANCLAMDPESKLLFVGGSAGLSAYPLQDIIRSSSYRASVSPQATPITTNVTGIVVHPSFSRETNCGVVACKSDKGIHVVDFWAGTVIYEHPTGAASCFSRDGEQLLVVEADRIVAISVSDWKTSKLLVKQQGMGDCRMVNVTKLSGPANDGFLAACGQQWLRVFSFPDVKLLWLQRLTENNSKMLCTFNHHTDSLLTTQYWKSYIWPLRTLTIPDVAYNGHWAKPDQISHLSAAHILSDEERSATIEYALQDLNSRLDSISTAPDPTTAIQSCISTLQEHRTFPDWHKSWSMWHTQRRLATLCDVTAFNGYHTLRTLYGGGNNSFQVLSHDGTIFAVSFSGTIVFGKVDETAEDKFQQVEISETFSIALEISRDNRWLIYGHQLVDLQNATVTIIPIPDGSVFTGSFDHSSRWFVYGGKGCIGRYDIDSCQLLEPTTVDCGNDISLLKVAQEIVVSIVTNTEQKQSFVCVFNLETMAQLHCIQVEYLSGFPDLLVPEDGSGAFIVKSEWNKDPELLAVDFTSTRQEKTPLIGQSHFLKGPYVFCAAGHAVLAVQLSKLFEAEIDKSLDGFLAITVVCSNADRVFVSDAGTMLVSGRAGAELIGLELELVPKSTVPKPPYVPELFRRLEELRILHQGPADKPDVVTTVDTSGNSRPEIEEAKQEEHPPARAPPADDHSTPDMWDDIKKPTHCASVPSLPGAIGLPQLTNHISASTAMPEDYASSTNRSFVDTSSSRAVTGLYEANTVVAVENVDVDNVRPRNSVQQSISSGSIIPTPPSSACCEIM